MTTRRTGGCQCGDIRYEITGEPQQIVVCHCTACQRWSGSAFGMSVVIDASDFRLLQGELETWSSQSDTGRAKLAAFCRRCGTRIYHRSEWRGESMSVKAGTLDDTHWLLPDIHIWTGSGQPWVVIPEGVETHETQPVRPEPPA